MTKKVYYLSTCDTCKRIMREVGVDDSYLKLDIKKEHINGAQLDGLKEKVGSYEALVNKLARKYKSQGIKDKNLDELGYRKLILSDYTFLKRPVFVLGEEVFAGNSKKTVEALLSTLQLLA